MQKRYIKAAKNNLGQRLGRRLPNSLFLAITLALTSTSALANKDDFGKPIEIDSGTQNIDLKESTTTFKTDVSVTQGSLSISADFMKVSRQDKKGKEMYIATGSPAVYKQLLEDGKPIVAQANKILYDVASRSLILTGNAQLKQNDSLVKGETIRYDLTNQTLQAEGLDGQPVKSVFNTQSEDDPKDNQEPNKS